MTVTTIKITTGFFQVLNNGVKTDWQIINGDLGSSGNAKNMYGIKKGDAAPKWIGSLAKCRKTIELSLKKAGV